MIVVLFAQWHCAENSPAKEEALAALTALKESFCRGLDARSLTPQLSRLRDTVNTLMLINTHCLAPLTTQLPMEMLFEVLRHLGFEGPAAYHEQLSRPAARNALRIQYEEKSRIDAFMALHLEKLAQIIAQLSKSLHIGAPRPQ